MSAAYFDDTRAGTSNGNGTRADIYLYIERYVRERGYAPSQREIARACYLAQSTVRYHLRVLAAQGKIEIERGKYRGIRLTEAV